MAKKPDPLVSVLPTPSVSVPLVVTPSETPRDSARVALVKADSASYGARIRYAEVLVADFGAFFWRKDSASYKAWKTEETAFMDMLKATNPDTGKPYHSNPSKAKGDLLKAAEKASNPNADTGKGKGEKSTLTERQKSYLAGAWRSGEFENRKAGLSDAEKRVHLEIQRLLVEVMGVAVGDIKDIK